MAKGKSKTRRSTTSPPRDLAARRRRTASVTGGDEVLVAFEHGQLRKPAVLGKVWTGTDRPPQSRA